MLKMNLPENYMVHAALASTYAQLGEMDRAKAALDHGERIHVVQAKTAAKLRIPVHMELRKALDAHARVSPIILTTASGKPFTGSYFRHHWRKAMAAAGLEGLVFHGNGGTISLNLDVIWGMSDYLVFLGQRRQFLKDRTIAKAAPSTLPAVFRSTSLLCQAPSRRNSDSPLPRKSPRAESGSIGSSTPPDQINSIDTRCVAYPAFGYG